MRATRPDVSLDPSLVFVAAWSLISVGAASHFGTYTPRAVVMVTAGMALLTLGVVRLGKSERRPASWLSLVVLCVVAGVSAQIYAAGEHARGAAETWAHGLLLGAGIGLLYLVLGRRERPWIRISIVVLAGSAASAGIMASQRPPIDVWFMLQGASHALSHLRNFYTQTWPGSHGITNLYVYLPGTTILLTPFFVAFGDVRYGLLAALLVTALAVRRLASGVTPVLLSCLVMLFPRVLYGIEQSWTEPLLLALLAGMVWAVETERPVFAIVCFAAALATKQHMLILLPLAVRWPGFGWRRTLTAVGGAAVIVSGWVLASPQAFVRGAFTYNLKLPPRVDSLSLFTTAIRMGWTPSFVIVPLLMALVLAVALRSLPRTSPGFVLGSAWLLGMFDLLNKQSFFNEWSLVVGLIIVGMATMSRALPTATVDEPCPTTPFSS